MTGLEALVDHEDKRRFDPNAPLKRNIGETIGGNMTPMQRREAALNKALRNQLDNLTRREELMAAEVLRTGKVTVAGEDFFGGDVLVGAAGEIAETGSLCGRVCPVA